MNSYHWLNTVGDPVSILCQLAVLHEDSSFDLAMGCRDNLQSMSVILTSSACMPSYVMARRTSLSICMLPWVMARLCAQSFPEVRFSLLGHGLVRLFLFGHGLVRLSLFGNRWVRVSLSGHGWVRVSLSGHGLDATNSLKAWIRAEPSHFERGLSLLGIGQSHHVSDVRSLDPGYLSICILSAGRV